MDTTRNNPEVNVCVHEWYRGDYTAHASVPHTSDVRAGGCIDTHTRACAPARPLICCCNSAVAQWVEPQTFDSSAAVPNRGQVVFNLHCTNSLSCIYECLAIDIGGYLCTNNLRVLVPAWLDAP